jgi:3alpha(or 20beta)-hydroxysteroid dehydrogenase
MPQLDGKVAFISGAARGQGAAEARLFVTEGARVMLGDVLVDEGRKTAAALGPAAAFVAHDVTDEAAWQRAIDETVQRFGRLDILINNAGIFTGGSVESTSLDDYMRLVRINQVGVFLGMKAALPALKANGGGAIVNISSLAGMHGSPKAIGYGATKWAVRGMTKSAAREFAPYGIRVNSVHPSVVDTPMVAGMLQGDQVAQMLGDTPMGRVGTVDDVAKVVLFLVTDASGYCTGGEFLVDGGRHA